ncbi:MAG TPA: hypothetical protein HPP87_12950 [Planctomycetes bacterium]|nr:hypothetical protein [Planctomycetota bacterium]
MSEENTNTQKQQKTDNQTVLSGDRISIEDFHPEVVFIWGYSLYEQDSSDSSPAQAGGTKITNERFLKAMAFFPPQSREGIYLTKMYGVVREGRPIKQEPPEKKRVINWLELSRRCRCILLIIKGRDKNIDEK